MLDELKKFYNNKPEFILHWKDDLSPAEGWLVVNSWRGGAAGGGTRMHAKCSLPEMVELAKTMEIKFSVAGPEIGGAKSGIAYDFKNADDKRSILRRWFGFIDKELKTHYGTGGDQNVDMLSDVVPILNDLGIKHPQEGIVRGHYADLTALEKDKIIENLWTGVSLPLETDQFLRSINFNIADVATGYGVNQAIGHMNKIGDWETRGKRMVVEGFGNVGAATAYFGHQDGIKVVGIIDKDWYLFSEDGIDIPGLLNRKVKNDLGKSIFPDIQPGKPSDLPAADIFVPAATSHTINLNRLEMLKKNGIKVIVCGANNPFSSEQVLDSADSSMTVIPDFIANSGMARVFSYLMNPDCELKESAILADIGQCVGNAMSEVKNFRDSWYNITDSAYRVALFKLHML